LAVRLAISAILPGEETVRRNSSIEGATPIRFRFIQLESQIGETGVRLAICDSQSLAAVLIWSAVTCHRFCPQRLDATLLGNGVFVNLLRQVAATKAPTGRPEGAQRQR